MNRFKRRNLILSSFGLLAVSFFVVHRVFLQTPGVFERIASYCVYPVVLIHHRCIEPIERYWQKGRSIGALEKQIDALIVERDTLRAQLIAYEASQEFVQQTAELIEYAQRYETDHMRLCQIIMRRFNDHENVFFVDAGAAHGIVKDMAAVYKNQIIGRVVQVYPLYSQIVSMTDKRCQIAAYCNRSQTPGIFQGLNSVTQATVQHVDRLKTIIVGDQLFSSGEGTVFPRGFLLGTIESFEPEGVHYRVVAKPAQDITMLSYCYLMQKGSVARITPISQSDDESAR